MLPKKHRLSKSAEVKLTTARGRSFFNPYFVIKYAKTTELPKVTVIASLKVSKKAVVRNRLKRVVRDVVRQFIGKLEPGTYAIILKAKAGTIDSGELKRQVTATFTTTKLLKQ